MHSKTLVYHTDFMNLWQTYTKLDRLDHFYAIHENGQNENEKQKDVLISICKTSTTILNALSSYI